MQAERLKQLAAEKAIEYVESGMIVGLGTGSTSRYFTELLAAKVRSGNLHSIRCVPTSVQVGNFASKLGLELYELDKTNMIDLAVDGADEISPNLDLIKGLGKALLREKVVEINAKRFIVIADKSKLVPRLGMSKPLPVEILPFAWKCTVDYIQGLGCKAELWLEHGQPVVTDNHNYLVKCWFKEGIDKPDEIANLLIKRPGIVEHGLFINIADMALVADDMGVKVLERSGP